MSSRPDGPRAIPLLNCVLRPAAPATEADWEQLYSTELPRIYNFFRYRIGNDALAEDVTATTFEKAWRARRSYRRDLAGFSTWLFTIARNVATDYFRTAPSRRPPAEAAPGAEQSPPEESTIRRSDRERLAVLLAALPARERELLSLKYGSGLTNRAIARITRMSESTEGTILHRAVLAIRERW